MSVRLRAITNSTGACRLAATVCPASTLREITMPSTGARMVVRSRSTLACASSDSRCLTRAMLLRTCASPTIRCACAVFTCSAAMATVDCDVSSAAVDTNPFSTSIWFRFRLRSASASATCARDTSACSAFTLARWVISVARLASRSPIAWLTRSSKDCGSMRAMTSPCFTTEL
jgi:hypothetical protein